ncbi:SWIM zinc finger family protein [Paenibacillus sp. P25]|nr:SWIM zinc finger family protein [Paenibacillus sp. P25]
MLKLQIPKNRMKMLIGHLRDDVDLPELERGWEYFHKGQVTGIELVHGVEIHALVRGTKAYEVQLDLDDFAKSECSCPIEEPCRHMAGVVFALYASFARPESLLQRLKQAKLVKSRQQQARQAGARSEKRQDRVDVPEPKMAPSAWHRYFDQQFYGFSLSQQHSIELFYSTAKEKLGSLGESWPEALQKLYRLHLLLFVMRKIEQFYQDTKTSYLSYYIETGCRTVGRQCMDESLRLVPELDVKTLMAKHPAHWKETLALVSDTALSGKESPLSWLTVYRSIWWRMTGRPDWMEEERKRLKRMLDAQELMPRRRDALVMAEAHFEVIEGHDEEARRLDGDARQAGGAGFLPIPAPLLPRRRLGPDASLAALVASGGAAGSGRGAAAVLPVLDGGRAAAGGRCGMGRRDGGPAPADVPVLYGLPVKSEAIPRLGRSSACEPRFAA